MMQRIRIGVFLIMNLLMVWGCQEEQEKETARIRIHGEVINPPSEQVILERFVRGEYVKVDSNALSGKGSFSFDLQLSKFNYYAINYPGSGRLPIVVGQRDLYIKADFRMDPPQFEVRGAPDMDDIFIVQKIKNFFSGFKPGFRNEPPGRDAEDFMNNSDVTASETHDQDGLHTGTPAPELVLPTPEGSMVALTDFRGTVVLVDFWAAWCRPCREAHPELRRMYDRYNARGFEILSVSLDRNRAQWVQAISEDSLGWSQVSDLKYFNSEVIEKFGVEFLPSNLLVDAQGLIVARNISIDSVKRHLEVMIGP
jgi:peroxiredoxin